MIIDKELFNQFRSILDKKNTIKISSLIFLKIFESLLTLIPSYIIYKIFDEILPSFDFIKLLMILVFFILYYIIYSVIKYITASINIEVSNNLKKRAREKLVTAILNKNIFQIDKYSYGDLIYRINTDISIIISTLVSIIVNIPVNVVFLVIVVIILFKINLLLTLIILSLTILQTIYNIKKSRMFHIKSIKLKETEGNTINVIQELISRHLFIKLNRLMNQETARYMNALDDSLVKSKEVSLYTTFHNNITMIISGFSQMSIIMVGAYLINLGDFTIALLLSYMNMNQKINYPIQYLVTLPITYKDCLSSFERINPLIKASDNKYEKVVKMDRDIHINLSNISFSYQDKQILKDFNLTVYKYDRIAIIGTSGSGKSSLCKIIASIYPYDGEIMLQPFNDFQPIIGFVIDESSLFKGTLRENLTYGWAGPKIKDSEIRQILKEVLLDRSLSHLFNNLDTIIDKNMFSKGEKQRLELARIMLLQPQLIILDEPTSGLDAETEKIVWNNFRRRCEESTLLYTTHELSLIFPNDRVVNINKEQQHALVCSIN